jgi:glycerol-3-phosphate acyltransferase PlsY
MKIQSEYWKPRLPILGIGILSLLGGLNDIFSKHAGRTNGAQYFGVDALLIGIVFAVAGVICLIVGFMKKPQVTPSEPSQK